MKVCVLLRRLRGAPNTDASPDDASRLGSAGPRDGAPAAPASDAASFGPLLGGCDRAALASALALAPRVPGSTVAVLAAGAAVHEDELLRSALAVGATHAVRVADGSVAALDYHAVAQVLAGALRVVGFDLVLVGDRSEDEMYGALGPAVAEWLGIPHITGVVDLTCDEAHPDRVVATRPDGAVIRRHQVPLPAVVSVRAFAGEKLAIDQAEPDRDAKIQVLSLGELGIHAAELKHRDHLVGVTEPTVAKKAELLTDAKELARRLRTELADKDRGNPTSETPG